MDDEDEEQEVRVLLCLVLATKLTFQTIDVKALQHRREINKKTKSGDKRLRKQLKGAQKVCKFIDF